MHAHHITSRLSCLAIAAISHCPQLDHHSHLKAWLEEQRTLIDCRRLEQRDRDYERKIYRQERQRRKAAERRQEEVAYIRLLISEGYFGENGEHWRGTKEQWEAATRKVPGFGVVEIY
ncbi:hypothetical protein Tdes44962_MAKER00362 [Teratosphaeria destructans]|uniref:Uncharacterized protein n=1 Tax=Teratosphaeria destructans TaxID=418781 RepID=A0A9W7SS60_9PEZI|nr:hypothetical protein Tdes44962_MAKER00362 [Teratosphaeria destructans]